MNPYGTYYGNQRHHHGRANDQILDTYTLVAAQGKSIAPSYNGSAETAIFGLYPMSGNHLSEDEKTEICAFADGALITADKNDIAGPFINDNITLHESNADGINEKDLKNPVLTGLSGNLGKYVTNGVKAITHIIKTQIKAK